MKEFIVHGPSGPISRNAEVGKRRAQMPSSQRGIYDRATGGKSKAMAIKAFCYECMGYDRSEVLSCSDPACPLWMYRPGRSVSGKAQDGPLCAVESTNGT